MKKLLLYIGNLEIGGAQRVVYELVKNVKEYEVFVLVHSSDPKNSLSEKIVKEADVRFLNIEGSLTVKNFFKVMKAIRKIDPDVVHCHLGVVYLGYFWCRLHKRKCVATVHTRPDAAFNGNNLKAIRSGLKRRDLELVAVSEENRRLCNEFFKTDSVHFVNNGVDISKFYRKEHEGFAFINVARQDENKNQKLIVDCFSRLIAEGFSVKLYLLGDGPEHSALKNYAAELGVSERVVFTGNVGNVEDYYALSDCFLLSSHREALPMTAIEACAAGLPVISTDVGGMKDIVSNNGTLVKDGDSEAFYDAMKNAVIKGKFRCLESIETAKLFSSKKMAEQYESIYK